MRDDEQAWWSAAELAAAIRARQVSPVEGVERCLARIAALNPRLNAFCTVAADAALAAARQAERQVMAGGALGPLHGVPLAIKDMTHTADIRTTFGSAIFEHFVPDEDAAVVARLKAAGAIVVGKTSTPEFAMKGTTDSPLFGVTRNPWDTTLTPGGSSGGAAAALAAGLVPLAEGTDVAGSVRIPAAMCAVVGLKPSPGRVPRYPTPDPWDTMNVHGAMARDVRDTALLFSAMCGPDARDPLSLPSSGEDWVAACAGELPPLRVAWSADLGFAAVDRRVAAVAGTAARAFGELGCTVSEASPDLAPLDPELLFIALFGPQQVRLRDAYLAGWGARMDPYLVRLLQRPIDESAAAWERANERRRALWLAVSRFFTEYDLLLTPTVAVPPFAADPPAMPTAIEGRALRSALAWYPFTHPFNMACCPAIAVPAGWTDDGLPVGLQIVAPRLGEWRLLEAAAAYERVRPWAGRHPRLG